MNRSELESLELAASSSAAQMALTQDFGIKTVRRRATKKLGSTTSQNAHLSRISDKLRKEYDGVIQFAANSEMRHLLSQLD